MPCVMSDVVRCCPVESHEWRREGAVEEAGQRRQQGIRLQEADIGQFHTSRGQGQTRRDQDEKRRGQSQVDDHQDGRLVL